MKGKATAVWREAGEGFEAVSSCFVRVRLKLVRGGLLARGKQATSL